MFPMSILNFIRDEFWFPERKRGRNQLYVGSGLGYAKIRAGTAGQVPTLSFYITRSVHLALIYHTFSGTWHHHHISQLSRSRLVEYSFYELFFTSTFSMELRQPISYHLPENLFSSIILHYDPSSFRFCYFSVIKPINWCPTIALNEMCYKISNSAHGGKHVKTWRVDTSHWFRPPYRI